MNEHERDAAAAAALGALTPDEAARLEEEATRNPELAAELDEYRATITVLEASIARERPPADLFDRVLERLEPETTPIAAPRSHDVARWRKPMSRIRARRLVPAFVAGVATAAAAIALVFALSDSDGLGSPDALAAVAGTEEFPNVRGEARLHGATGDDGVVVVDLVDVPTPAAGEHYEVWVLREASGGEMEAVGVFRPTSSSVDLRFTLPGPGDYQAVDVSVEEDGGAPEHSGRSLAGGRFEPTA